ncbi:MAG: response regulator [Chloroflexi bacterium]|nr:response regulator [Chloroflexota bacterium]MBK6711013.1 response regulator [Chloroflexota bacterium]MBP6802832.1 response regulator [Chloroflexota bacterium]
MSETIRVLIVDDLPETRENVRKLLQFESDIEVIGQAGTGEQAVDMAQEHRPDIILMDINMPGIDGIGASQKISELVPTTQIIIMSVQSDSDYLRRAMLAGARDFLTKPFGGDELVAAVRRVHAKRPVIRTGSQPMQTAAVRAGSPQTAVAPVRGHMLAVFSPKGGSGCTTLAINMAISLASSDHRTILVDGSLQFGDVAVMLNMKPVTSVVDLSARDSEIDADLINSVVQVHRSGLHVLMSPPRPEMADVVTEASLKVLWASLRQIYDYIIVDTTSSLNDIALSILDEADRILLVTQQNLPSLKNVSRFFDLAQSLEYQQKKVWLVVNRLSTKQGISVKDISETLKRPVLMTIPEDDLTVSAAIDQGVPVILGSNKKKPIGLALVKLAQTVAQELGKEKIDGTNGRAEKADTSGLFGRLFGKR